MANNAKRIGKNEEPPQQAEGGGDIIRQIQDSLQETPHKLNVHCFVLESVFSPFLSIK